MIRSTSASDSHFQVCRLGARPARQDSPGIAPSHFAGRLFKSETPVTEGHTGPYVYHRDEYLFSLPARTAIDSGGRGLAFRLPAQSAHPPILASIAFP